MKTALTVVATLAALGLIALVIPYTGFINVSAVGGHSGLMEWYMNQTSTRSIRAHADGIVAPTNLADSTVMVRGGRGFVEMCQSCHGGPGVVRTVTGQGMLPLPPNLSETSTEWKPNEIYWILENGIKMAGMPAYGPTHSAEELWEIVAFVKALPEMDSLRYARLTEETEPNSSDENAPPGHEGHDHMH